MNLSAFGFRTQFEIEFKYFAYTRTKGRTRGGGAVIVCGHGWRIIGALILFVDIYDL